MNPPERNSRQVDQHNRRTLSCHHFDGRLPVETREAVRPDGMSFDANCPADRASQLPPTRFNGAGGSIPSICLLAARSFKSHVQRRDADWRRRCARRPCCEQRQAWPRTCNPPSLGGAIDDPNRDRPIAKHEIGAGERVFNRAVTGLFEPGPRSRQCGHGKTHCHYRCL